MPEIRLQIPDDKLEEVVLAAIESGHLEQDDEGKVLEGEAIVQGQNVVALWLEKQLVQLHARYLQTMNSPAYSEDASIVTRT